VLTVDGHCTYSPDKRWILTDTYPDSKRMITLMLYRPEDGKLVKLGRFYHPKVEELEFRCDLHPRWSRDGKTISIDSLHSGQRQIYVLDVSGIIKGS
jgi:Tol biopolymer transport system component